MDKNKGFTLIELIVVIAIITLFAGLSLSGYRNLNEQSKLRSDARKMADVLELAKTKSSSAELYNNACTNFNGYQVAILGNSYSLNFCCDAACATPVQSYDLQSNISVITGTGTVQFLPLTTGAALSFTPPVRIKNSMTNQCMDVNISPIGLVDISTYLFSCP